MKYCKRCVYPEAAVNLYIDEDGICSSCRTFEAFEALDTEFWAQRQSDLSRLLMRGSVKIEVILMC